MQKNGYSKQESETRINHFNQDGTDNGYSELRTNGFGDKVWVHHDSHGLFIGESEWGTDIMGDDELIHRDKDGAFSGTSKNYKRAFIDETVVRDEKGFVTGTSTNKNSAWDGNHKQHYTNTDQNTKYTSSSSGTENALYSLLGKIVGGILAICAIIWLAVAVVLPLIIINAALVFFIWALFSSKGRKFLMPFATLAGIYVAVDFFYAHWFTKSLSETVTFLNDVIPWMVYAGILAGTTAAYFTIRNFLNTNNPERINEGEFSKSNVIIAASILGIIALIGGGSYAYSHYGSNSLTVGPISPTAAFKVKQSNSYYYKYNNGILEKEGKLDKTTTYNSKGQITTEIKYGIDGSVSKWTYVYDDLGNKIEETFPSFGSRIQHMVYQYDVNNNQIESKTYINDVLDLTIIKKYDDKGHMIEQIYTAPNGNVNYRNVYVYNENGWNTEILNYDNKGSLIDKYVKKYDKDGNNIEQIPYSADGTLTCCGSTFKYDQFHNMIEQQLYSGISKKGTKNEWKYDSDHRMIDEVYYYEGGERGSHTTYKYADNGLEYEKIIYNEKEIPGLAIKTVFQ